MKVIIRGCAALVGVVVVAVLAGPAAVLGNPRFSPSPRPLSRSASQDRAAASGIPTLGQLLANFAVLRRHQTSADRSWRTPPPGSYERPLPRLTRLARQLPDGTRIFLTVQQYTGPGWPSVYPAGKYELDIYIVAAKRKYVVGTNFGPNVNYNVFPISTLLPPFFARHYPPEPKTPTWASIIPDGASRVRWTFSCGGCRRGQRPVTVSVRAAGNVAAALIPATEPGRQPSGTGRRHWQPMSITWYGRGGRVVASYGRSSHNLSAPPFIKTRSHAPA